MIGGMPAAWRRDESFRSGFLGAKQIKMSLRDFYRKSIAHCVDVGRSSMHPCISGKTVLSAFRGCFACLREWQTETINPLPVISWRCNGAGAFHPWMSCDMRDTTEMPKFGLLYGSFVQRLEYQVLYFFQDLFVFNRFRVLVGNIKHVFGPAADGGNSGVV